jgi:uracil-DNA glycosylase
MTDRIPASWAALLEPVLATPEARRLGGWLRADAGCARWN